MFFLFSRVKKEIDKNRGFLLQVLTGIIFFVLIQMTLPISVEDVKREVKILRTLSGHENVVQFYAAFEDDDLVYIVME